MGNAIGSLIQAITNFIVTGVGGIINYFVNSVLRATNGIKFLAVLAVLGVIALTALYSLFGKAKFAPKDANFEDIQAREVQRALKTYKFPIKTPVKTPVEAFNERKLAYLQKPYILPSIEV